MFSVLITEKGGTRQILKFDRESISIGRVQGNDIVLPRGNVSKHHAKIELKNNQFLLYDSGSTNGTYINGRRVREPIRIFESDTVYVGDYIVSLSGHEALTAEEQEEREQVEKTDAPISSPQALSFTKEPLPKMDSDPNDMISSSDGRLEKSEKARTSSMSMILKKLLPRPDDERSTDVQIGKDSGKAKLFELVEYVLERVSKEIKRVDRASIPLKLDAGIAGRVRLAIDDAVNDLISRGKLPPDISAGGVRGRAFRQIVDLGPLDLWLDDDEVKMIRVSRHDFAYLHKGGKWVEATSSFLTREDMVNTLRCLETGLERHGACEGEAEGVSWFQLEEGYRVVSALPPAGTANPSLFVDKTTFRFMEGEKDALSKAARNIIAGALNKFANIAVLGESVSVRISVLESIIGLASQGDFIVSVERVPIADSISSKRLKLIAQRQCMPITHALAMEPDRLIIAGTEARDIPDVLQTAVGISGVIAELPLCAAEHLDLELMASMIRHGAPVSRADVSALASKAFELLVIARRDKAGLAGAGQICQGWISKDGFWTIKTLFAEDNSSAQ